MWPFSTIKQLKQKIKDLEYQRDHKERVIEVLKERLDSEHSYYLSELLKDLDREGHAILKVAPLAVKNVLYRMDKDQL